MTPQTAWAAGLIDALVAVGVTDLVVSPGSRSTPLVLAATRRPELALHAIIDERSAGFFALGLAKAAGRPAALLCTSGSAGAHYYPAVIEAAYAHVPLLVFTADRPPELFEAGASQTIDQRQLFGAHVRAWFDLSAPEPGADALRGARRKLAQAAALSRAPTPGPVHVNVPLRKPLEPATLAELHAGPFTPLPRVAPGRSVPDADAIAALVEAIVRSPRGVIVCGPGPLSQASARHPVRALAARAGYPLLAEAASQLKFGAPGTCDGFDAALRSRGFRDAHAPSLVLQLGPAPVSSGWCAYAERYQDHPRYVVAPHGWHDPHNAAACVLTAELPAAIDALLAALPERPADPAWLAAFADADARGHAALEADLAARGTLSEAAVARRAVAALPAGGLLAVGNSGPIRAVDAFCRGADADVAVLSQRGAAGIDGLIASAAGAACVTGTPALLLLGDVSFAHDLGSLAVAREVRTPLCVCVIDNRGGRIFEQLPVARLGLGDALERLWLTPPRIELAAAARAFGVGYQRCDDADELSRVLSTAMRTPRCTVVHAIVPPDSVGAQLSAVWEALG